MPKYLGALTIVLLLGMVLTRVFLLKRQGIKAMKFGSTDKTDFLIPPFAEKYGVNEGAKSRTLGDGGLADSCAIMRVINGRGAARREEGRHRGQMVDQWSARIGSCSGIGERRASC